MKQKKQNNTTRDDDLFLELCQQYAELSQRDEDLAVSSGETEYEALERLDDREAERKILLWRILTEVDRTKGGGVGGGVEQASRARKEITPRSAAQEAAVPEREWRETRTGAFIEQLGSFLRAPFRGASSRPLG
jgi:hypothetical protein